MGNVWIKGIDGLRELDKGKIEDDRVKCGTADESSVQCSDANCQLGTGERWRFEEGETLLVVHISSYRLRTGLQHQQEFLGQIKSQGKRNAIPIDSSTLRHQSLDSCGPVVNYRWRSLEIEGNVHQA